MGDGLKRAFAATKKSRQPAILQAQIKRLKIERRALKRLARELHTYVVHDSCAGSDDGERRWQDDDNCDCGLSDVEVTYRRLIR